MTTDSTGRHGQTGRSVEPVSLPVETRHGPAVVHLHRADPAVDPRAWLVLGHGAGGGVGAPDLVAVTAAATRAGVTVALVEQPYRVAGRRAAAPLVARS